MLVWEEFARRYADRWIIGGYDLINEPLSGPDCAYLIPQLAEFYDELIQEPTEPVPWLFKDIPANVTAFATTVTSKVE